MTNGCNIFLLAIEYAKLYHSKALENLAKMVFLVWKYTIWQPWILSGFLEKSGKFCQIFVKSWMIFPQTLIQNVRYPLSEGGADLLFDFFVRNFCYCDKLISFIIYEQKIEIYQQPGAGSWVDFTILTSDLRYRAESFWSKSFELKIDLRTGLRVFTLQFLFFFEKVTSFLFLLVKKL
jgi:hypothetical protein